MNKPKVSPIPERFKIKYEFNAQKFDYELPLVTVDVEFLKERRAEIRNCFAQLAKRIGQINIVTAVGVGEMDTAAKLTRYYFYASKLIEGRYLDLTTDKGSGELSDEYMEFMREQYREKTI